MYIVTPDEMRAAIHRTLGSLLGPTRAAWGCLNAHIYVDLDKPKNLLLVEEWESREQFESSLDSEKLNALVAAIELSCEAPVVRVDLIEREEGIEALARYRGVTGGAAR